MICAHSRPFAAKFSTPVPSRNSFRPVRSLTSQYVRMQPSQFPGARYARVHCYAADLVRASRENILRCVSYQPDLRLRMKQPTPPRHADGIARQSGPGVGRPRKGTEDEEPFEPRALQLFPSDPGQVAGDQRARHPLARQAKQQPLRSRTGFRAEIRAGSLVHPLGFLQNGRHRGGNRLRRGSRPPHHFGENVRIEHAVHRDVLRRGFESGNRAHSIHQRLPVMRAGAANQRAVDIEK